MDFKKVSPMAGMKRIFGIDGLMQFAKSVVKILAVAVLAWWILKPHLSAITRLATLDPVLMLPLMADVLRRLVFAVAGRSSASWSECGCPSRS